MPYRIPTACSVCQRRDCMQHKRKDERPNASQRGYDAAWRRVRKMKLDMDPLCEPCSARGRVTAASEVHHERSIRSHPELRLDLGNLVSACRPCHARIEGSRRRGMQ
jgi:5-methylcytosine-specific restriction protein A